MAKAPEWYLDFADRSHRPAADDVVALFRYDRARGITDEEAVGRIASESSVGTWTTLAEPPKKLWDIKATGFGWDGERCKVAYPLELWEPGNLPQLLSGVAGNIFGMKAIPRLRLLDLRLPRSLLKEYEGPRHGIPGVRAMLKVPKRALTATVPKPKLGYTAREHAEVGFEVWRGGVDVVKDDENLTDQSFNRFEERVARLAKLRDKAEAETGERKTAFLNITAEVDEARRRAKVLADLGWEYAMVDVVVTGFAGLQSLRKTCGELGLAIHAHRAMHAMFTKDPRHGMSMPCLSKLMRLVGVESFHVGTVVGKLDSPKAEVEGSLATLRAAKVAEGGLLLEQDWGGLKPAFPVPSGGLHPGLLPDIHRLFGDDMVLQVGGGVLGHPDGARAGAAAVRQALDAAGRRVPLREAARRHPELARALEKWGKVRPV